MSLTVAGKIELLTQFISEDYYLGLFINTGDYITVNPGFSIATKLSDISALELNKLEYERFLIEPSDWILDENSLSIYVDLTKNPMTFAPKLQDWNNIQGYFLSHTLDNSGDLIYIYTYWDSNSAIDSRKNLVKNQDTLQIQPRIFFN